MKKDIVTEGAEPVDPEDGRTFRLKVAHGLMWMLIWLGFGGCCMMVNHGTGPAVRIETEAPKEQHP